MLLVNRYGVYRAESSSNVPSLWSRAPMRQGRVMFGFLSSLVSFGCVACGHL